MLAKRIVLGIQTAKVMRSLWRQMPIGVQVPIHLGILMRGFQSSGLKQDFVLNSDETHFIVDLNDV